MSTSRKALFTLVTLGLAAFAAHPASAQSVVTGTITGLYNTGVDSTTRMVLPNDTLNDPNYTLTSVPSGSTTTTVVRTGNGFPLNIYNQYVPQSSTSAWIGPANTTGVNGDDLTGPGGNYFYTTSFMVSGLDPGFVGSAVISGNWVTDNTGGDILLNGVSTGNTNSGFNNGYSAFTINATNLTNGANTLTFEVNNDINGPADNPTGLRIDGLNASGVTASAAPEPSQIGMLALVAFGLGGLALKARKRTAAAQAA